MVQRRTAGDLPERIAAHRRNRVTVGQILQGLQRQHRRRDLTPQARPPGRGPDKSSNNSGGNSSWRCSARNANTLPVGTGCLTSARASNNSGSGLIVPLHPQDPLNQALTKPGDPSAIQQTPR